MPTSLPRLTGTPIDNQPLNDEVRRCVLDDGDVLDE